VMFLILLNTNHIKKIKSWKILTGSYYLLLSGWLFTVLEGFLLEQFLNLLEHICYAISAVLMIIWCRKSIAGAKEEEVA